MQALIVGADSVNIAQTLWQQPARRTVIEAGVVDILQEYEGTDAVAEIQPLVNELVELEIPATWVQSPLPLDNGGKLLIKLAGLVITAIAASRGSLFWYDMLKRVNPGSLSASSKKQTDAVDKSACPIRQALVALPWWADRSNRLGIKC